MDPSAKTHVKAQTFTTKICPECATHLALDAKACTWCQKKVGKVDKQGRAKRPVNWYSYLVCFLSWLALGLYIRWAFF
jgi:ribosomal protein L40E